MGFIISCDEATTICDKNQYGEASLMEKIQLNFHLLFCKYCKKYTKQNSFMSKVFEHFAKNCDSSDQLSEKEKDELDKKIKNNLHED